jgi:Na+/H+ antiporter NhaD/arsenite permease-like protein
MSISILEIASLTIAALALAGIAFGRIPPLRTNRAGIALAAAVALIAIGALSLDEAFRAIDLDTIALILAMMIVSAFLRFSGVFDLATAKLLRAARGPKSLLAIVILISGVFSAFFLNDTMCLVLSPLVIALCAQAGLPPLPYLIAVATSSNVGSMCTTIGNPQNMLIGSASGIGFLRFFLRLAPPAALGLIAVYFVILACFPKDFRQSNFLRPAPGPLSVNKWILIKTLLAAAVLVALLFAGLRPAFAALTSASILLLTRRVKPERVFGEIDVSLLIFFSGLFIITRSIREMDVFKLALDASLPYIGDKNLPFAAFSVLLSNLVSNVPAVMLLSPLVERFADRETAWLMLAMSSTLAGNLTLLGSVANLIVAESAKSRGIKLSFGAYLKAGLPITAISLCIGTAWLVML